MGRGRGRAGPGRAGRGQGRAAPLARRSEEGRPRREWSAGAGVPQAPAAGTGCGDARSEPGGAGRSDAAGRKAPRQLLAFRIIPAPAAGLGQRHSCLCVACATRVLYGICEPSELTAPFFKILCSGYGICLCDFSFPGSGGAREGRS